MEKTVSRRRIPTAKSFVRLDLPALDGKEPRSIMTRDGSRHGAGRWRRDFRKGWLLLAIVGFAVVGLVEPRVLGQQCRADTSTGLRAPVSRRATTTPGASRANPPNRTVLPGDDITLRPTVVVPPGHVPGERYDHRRDRWRGPGPDGGARGEFSRTDLGGNAPLQRRP